MNNKSTHVRVSQKHNTKVLPYKTTPTFFQLPHENEDVKEKKGRWINRLKTTDVSCYIAASYRTKKWSKCLANWGKIGIFRYEKEDECQSLMRIK